VVNGIISGKVFDTVVSSGRMKKALLIYNPSSGSNRDRRFAVLARILSVLKHAGVIVETCPTTHAGSAIMQTQREASRYDTILSCGGDGTANEVLNGLMLANSSAVLGVLPLGSGNLLATDLGLPRNPEKAARRLLEYKPRELHPGALLSHTKDGPQKRYFIVAAGVGSDAELMYRTAVEAKGRFGIYAYFLEMFRMALRGRFHMFQVEWRDQHGDFRSARVASVMAIRAARFPGLLQRVNLGSGLERNDYRLMIFGTDKVRDFLNYFASVSTGLNWRVRRVELAYSTWFRCTPLESQNPADIHSEVDGELLGTLPVEVSIEPRTFKLLMP
jgi:diacylglycerol kinase family enzyme